jgi:hypothetical protein
LQEEGGSLSLQYLSYRRKKQHRILLPWSTETVDVELKSVDV